MAPMQIGGVEVPALCFEASSPPEQPSFRLEALCRQAGENLKVRHVRDPRCPDTHITAPTRSPGEPLELSGLVVTGVFGDKLSAQDPEGGAYSGLWVYTSGRVDLGAVRPGDVVTLRGELIEYFTVTELVLSTDGLEVTSRGPAPLPLLVSETAKIADGGEWVEQLESMLVEVQAARVSNTAPDCPMDFGMFVVNRDLRIDPFYELDVTLGRQDIIERATGVLSFNFDHQKLRLRSPDDLQVVSCGGPPDKCQASECPVTIDQPETGRLIITELQSNPRGEDDLREWVELYNPNASPVDVAGWRLQDCGGNMGALSGSVPARGYFVVARSRDRAVNGDVRADAEMGTLFLPNGYGNVLLFDNNNALVDQVRYAPSGAEGWPVYSPGESLELMEPASDNRLGESWAAGRSSYGDGGDGTPGAAYRP